MSGAPETMVEKAVSTLKERDLLMVTLTRWTSLISLTKTPLEEARRSAASAPSAQPNKVSAAPRTIPLKATSLPPSLLATRPPPIQFPFADIRLSPQCTASAVLTTLAWRRAFRSALARQTTNRGLLPAEMRHPDHHRHTPAL